MNKNDFYEKLNDNPVIAAVKDEEHLEKALKSACNIIFLLYGSISNVKDIVDKAHENGKVIFLHLDLTEGFSKDGAAVEYIANRIKPDGIISTRAHQIKCAKDFGLLTVQRLFIIDSLSIENTVKSAKSVSPDAIEIMPGIMPRIIKDLSEKLDVPLIAGGLISYKDDVISALNSNAHGVSTTAADIWCV